LKDRKKSGNGNKTAQIMRITLLALLPGFAVFTWHFGIGVLLNVAAASVTAVICEALVLKLRSRPLDSLADGTAVLAGALLGLCLPPLLPFWMIAIGTGFAVVFGKHLYGGSGNNVFNPAMVGFAMLIISFPLAMSHWPAPGSTNSGLKDAATSFTAKLSTSATQEHYDGITAATPLDAYKFRIAATNDEFFAASGTQEINWQTWASINLAFLIGGLFLLYRKLIPWQIPTSFLATLGLLSLVFYDGGSSASLGSPAFTLFAGASMFTAFFIATDPVTCPGHRIGLLVFGAGVGLIVFIIRSWGAYPEGVAFAILLMNATAPLIDHVFTQRDRSTMKPR
jgi:electron transport complex protein RnfD|tara:strand:- start:13072 stop:14088 length:1017 start_codon:yes stop_codon:yes gene_type:complete